ncbi:laccase, multicopper oxidase, benzenediol:oxygen oxidorectuctase [Puccinia graminis f. sp. tritici]|uniref:Laccase, multicopper oxidase, benzenediol:oxygen oxidorectuctase n=1 Tax=Puccinia graminis f. sp. tritici TaxID=56615 RepID=A0A5B0RKR6_PUCGR|nr:laccase, multicopper oxidase, benzenediol:oxygen oxidorectuctase [Puccinia graminis f. sp. tritici]
MGLKCFPYNEGESSLSAQPHATLASVVGSTGKTPKPNNIEIFIEVLCWHRSGGYLQPYNQTELPGDGNYNMRTRIIALGSLDLNTLDTTIRFNGPSHGFYQSEVFGRTMGPKIHRYPHGDPRQIESFSGLMTDASGAQFHRSLKNRKLVCIREQLPNDWKTQFLPAALF